MHDIDLSCEVLSLRKGGGGWGIKSFSHAERGHKKYEVVFLRWGGGGAKSFHSLKGGAQKVLPCLEGGGGAKSFGPAFFPFYSPPPHN